MEKYHLALLQYLNQTEGYRIRHVYVEEFTQSFLTSGGIARPLSNSEIDGLKNNHPKSIWDTADAETLETLHQSTNGVLSVEGLTDLYVQVRDDGPPEYLRKWNLGQDAKLDDGIIYMATLNQKEPACQVMLGVIAMAHGDKNLARAAFTNAIQLRSPQAPILRRHLEYLNRYDSGSPPDPVFLPVIGIFLLIIVGVMLRLRAMKRRRKIRFQAQKAVAS